MAKNISFKHKNQGYNAITCIFTLMSSDEILEDLAKLISLLNKHEIYRERNTINLIASENVMSKTARVFYDNDLMHRYAEGKPGKRFYQGLKYIDEIEIFVTELVKDLFDSRFADIRLISGTIANLSTFYALKNKGLALEVGLSNGAHVTHEVSINVLGIKAKPLPFDLEEFNVDIDKAIKMIEEEKPDFVILGGSLYLFRHPIKEIAEITNQYNIPLIHDSAHVLGLHVKDVFKNPLKDGANIVTASTHKTFPGPQGGLILSNDEELFKKVYKVVFPYFESNYHLHRYLALGITALEMKKYGEKYANQIVKNAKVLAEELYSYGFKVLGENKGFTETHQIAVDVRDFGNGDIVAKKLEEANIIVNKNMLPWDSNPKTPSGIRIGVQEMTRFGMKEGEMKYIAELFKKVLIDRADTKKVKEEVQEFRKNYVDIRYSFDEEKILDLLFRAF